MPLETATGQCAPPLSHKCTKVYSTEATESTLGFFSTEGGGPYSSCRTTWSCRHMALLSDSIEKDALKRLAQYSTVQYSTGACQCCTSSPGCPCACPPWPPPWPPCQARRSCSCSGMSSTSTAWLAGRLGGTG